jgi:integrase
MRRRGKRVRDNRMHLDRHILPVLGDKRLPEVNSDVIQQFIRGLESKRTARPGEKNEAGRTLRPATIANVIITLRKMLTDLGYPVRVSYKVPTSGYAWIKSAADVRRFLDACRPGWFRTACELAVYAGLRQGEVAGLVWAAVDFDRGLLMIDRSYDGPTKSKQVRAVPLAPELAAHLRRWRLEHGAAGGEYVVSCPDGDGREVPLPADSEMGKRARRACKRAGVAPVTFHQLRHTAASHLAERVPLAIVGAVLGHADPKTTARYAHIDTAGLARDPRLHLRFEASSGTVTPLGLQSMSNDAGRAVGSADSVP